MRRNKKAEKSIQDERGLSMFVSQNKLLIRNSEREKKILSLVHKIKLLKIQLRAISLKAQGGEGGDVGIEHELKKLLDGFFKNAEKVEKEISNKILIKRLKRLFRTEMEEFFSQSSLVSRGNMKPRGYPGDYYIVEAMYNNKPSSNNIGFYLDKYFLANNYVQAVRDRKDSMQIILRDFIANFPKDSIRMMNLACGSSREIRELLSKKHEEGKDVKLILLDQDPEALRFSKRKIKRLSSPWTFKFVKSDFLKFLKQENNKNRKVDLIYSIGLADYLPDSILGLLFQFGFKLLSREGELIVAHKNTVVYTSPISDWGADWKFIPRDKKQIKSLISSYLKKGSYKLRFVNIKNKLIFYIVLQRKVKHK